MMEPSDRNVDLRDSTMVKSSQANRKGRAFAGQHDAQMAKEHVTPWGTDPSGSPTPSGPPMSPTRQYNHLQNQEAPAPQGTYSVPDVTPAHNHMQNAETDQVDGRLKMASSRINDGHIAFGAAEGDLAGTTGVLQPSDADRVRLKVAPGCSRINAGNDIFGEATPPPASVGRKPREEPFADRPKSGHIRNPWMGYTDATMRR